MIRPGSALWIAVILLVGYAMFQVKYEVAQQDEELARINKQIAATREATRVLNAEWSFLTQPARLSALGKRYLNLIPIGNAQLGELAAIPFRQAGPALVSAKSVSP
jgi:hypothetical protein